MATPKKLSAMKRFGTRYGRSLKQRFTEIENLHRRKYKCPYCSAEKVKRLSRGIWECRKCDAKFAGKAYTIAKKKTAKEIAQEIVEVGEVVEETPEEKEEEIIEKIPA